MQQPMYQIPQPMQQPMYQMQQQMQQPMYQMPQPMQQMQQPMQQQSTNDKIPVGVKIFIGFVVVILIVVIYNMLTDTTPPAPSEPTTGLLGGVTSADNPAAKEPDVNNPVVKTIDNTVQVPVKIAATPSTTIIPEVSVIEFIKDTTNMTNVYNDNADWVTFQIGEVMLYDSNGFLLRSGDFASAVYDPVALRFAATNVYDNDPKTFAHTDKTPEKIHKLILKLKKPTALSKAVVLNRQDCCQNRLAGVIVNFKDANGVVIKSQMLTSAMEQTAVFQ